MTRAIASIRKKVKGNPMDTEPSVSPPPSSSPVPLSLALESRVGALGGDRISIKDILRLLDDRSSWTLLLVLALPMAIPIPAPGLSVPFGACMMLTSAQIALGRNHVWVPEILARRTMQAATLAKVVRAALPTLRRLEKIVRPRKRWLAGDWMQVPIGVACLVLATIITLPIPLGHVVPGTAISLFALGMMERDGVTVWTGLAIAIAGVLLVVLASQGVYTGLNHWLKA